MFYNKYLVFDQNFKEFLTGNNFLSGNFEKHAWSNILQSQQDTRKKM